MADKIPVKAIFSGADVIALGEYQSGETVPIANGGTGATTASAARSALGIAGLASLPSFTASGAINAGKPVALTTAGLVVEIASSGSATIATEPGTAVGSYAAATAMFDYDTSNAVFCVGTRVTTNYPAVAGMTTNGTGFDIGTVYTIESVAMTGAVAVTRISAGLFCAVWWGAATTIKAALITVSAGRVCAIQGSVISMTVSTVTTPGAIHARANADGSKILVTGMGTTAGYAGVFSVSGGVLSAGSSATLGTIASGSSVSSLSYDEISTNWVLSYNIGGTAAPYTQNIRCITVSGTVPSLITAIGTPDYNVATVYPRHLCKLADGYYAQTEQNLNIGCPGVSISILKLTGTALTLVSRTWFEVAQGSYIIGTYDSVRKRIYVIGNIVNTGLSTRWVEYDEATHRITSQTLATALTVASSSIFSISSSGNALYVPSLDKHVVSHYVTSSSLQYLTWFTSEPSASTNFIGFAQSTVADTASVDVKTMGQIDSQQTGLTPAAHYYVAGNGTLTTTINNTFAGTAISATSILVKG